MATHYDTLGVRYSASAADIRSAYLAKARELHPDRHIDSSSERRSKAERDMQMVNEAFAAVGNSDARRRYDQAQLSTQSRRSTFESYDPDDSVAGGNSGSPDQEFEPERHHSAPLFHLMRSFPLLMVLGILGALFVFTAYASGNRTSDERRVGSIEPGACVTTAGDLMSWVPCDGSTTGIVQAVVVAEADCISRYGTTAMRMPDGKGFACLEPAGDVERP